MVNPTRECGKAATTVALEQHPKGADKTQERAAAKQRNALQKDLNGKCRNYFNKSAYTEAPMPEDVRTVTTAVSLTSDITQAILTRVKAFVSPSETPRPTEPTLNATGPQEVGKALNAAITDLFDRNNALPAFSFGNPDREQAPDPSVIPVYATSNLDYNTEVNKEFLEQDKVAHVIKFLQATAQVATAAWVAAAEAGKPTAADTRGSDAWYALQRLRVYANLVKNHPEAIASALAPLRAVIGDADAPKDPPKDEDPPKTSTDLPRFRIRVGVGAPVSGSCVNFTDDKATAMLSGRCLVPGDQQLAAGVGGALHLGVDFRAISNAIASLLLSLDLDFMWDPALDGLQLPNGIDQNVRNSLQKQTKGTFVPFTWGIRPGLAASLGRDNFGVRVSFGFGQTTWNGTGEKIFTGSANVINGGPPNADQLLDTTFLVMPTLTVFGGGYFTKSGGFQFGIEAFASISGMFYPTAGENTDFANRTITNDINRFMFEVGANLVVGW